MKIHHAASFSVTVIITLLPIAGCDAGNSDSADNPGDENENTDSRRTDQYDTDTETQKEAGPEDSDFEPPIMRAVLTVPDDFDGASESVDAVFFETQDITEPYEYGDTVHNPDIGVGTPFELEVGQAGLSGPFYMAVVLYCKGGGDGEEPVPGVDRVGMTEGPLALNPLSGTVEAGDIELQRFWSEIQP